MGRVSASEAGAKRARVLVGRGRAEEPSDHGSIQVPRASGQAVAGDGDGHFREVVETVPAAIYTTDAAGRITFYNEAAATLWGCRPELGERDFCGSWKLYWPDGTPMTHEECPMALALKQQRAVRDMEAIAERPDGTRVRFMAHPTPLYDASGALTGAVNMLVDITARHRTEERLSASEARYRGIFENACVAVWEEDFSAVADLLEQIRAEGVGDLRGYFRARPDRLAEAIRRVRLVDVNQFTIELFEAERKETLLGALGDIFLPETEPIFVEELVALWEGRDRFESEAALRTLRGRRLDVVFTMAFAGGRCERTLVWILDISARKAAERALLQQGQVERQLAAIVESCDDAIISKDLNGIITSWNRGAERLFGYTAEEVVGKPVTILFPLDRQGEEPRILERIRLGERVDRYETVRKRKDGSLVEISLTVSPIEDAEGRVVGASKIARDITERRRAEAHKELLLNEMKHRIKNNLATVQALATQTLHSATNDERASFTARLHALAGVHELMTYQDFGRARVGDLVRRALEPFQEKRQQRFLIEGPDAVSLDANRSMLLSLALHELATNAVKYGALSNESGTVLVAWELVKGNRLSLRWQESGGPAVELPERKGFGSRLIEWALGAEAGDSHLEFAPDGVKCMLDVAV